MARDAEGLRAYLDTDDEDDIPLNELESRAQASRLGYAYPLGWALIPSPADARLKPAYRFGKRHLEVIEALIEAGARSNANYTDFRVTRSEQYYPRQLTPLECALLFWPWELAPIWFLVVKAQADPRLPLERPSVFACLDPRALWLLLHLDTRKGQRSQAHNIAMIGGGGLGNNQQKPLFLVEDYSRTIYIDPTLPEVVSEMDNSIPNSDENQTERHSPLKTLNCTLAAALLDAYLPLPNYYFTRQLADMEDSELRSALSVGTRMKLAQTNEGADATSANHDKEGQASGSINADEEEAGLDEVKVEDNSAQLVHVVRSKPTWHPDFDILQSLASTLATQTGSNVSSIQPTHSEEHKSTPDVFDWSFVFDANPIVPKVETPASTTSASFQQASPNPVPALSGRSSPAALSASSSPLDQDAASDPLTRQLLSSIRGLARSDSLRPKLGGRGTDRPLRIGEFLLATNHDMIAAAKEGRDLSSLASLDAWMSILVRDRRAALLMIFILLKFGFDIDDPLPGPANMSFFQFAEARLALWEARRWPAVFKQNLDPVELDPISNNFLQALRTKQCWLEDDFSQIERSVSEILTSEAARAPRSPVAHSSSLSPQ